MKSLGNELAIVASGLAFTAVGIGYGMDHGNYLARGHVKLGQREETCARQLGPIATGGKIPDECAGLILYMADILPRENPHGYNLPAARKMENLAENNFEEADKIINDSKNKSLGTILMWWGAIVIAGSGIAELFTKPKKQ